MNIKKIYFYFRKLFFYFEFGAHGGLPASVGPGVDRPSPLKTPLDKTLYHSENVWC